ncbi:MAG: SprT-like domain-containing protein [candidate division Zixibacteria bacterium]|nr:SprT-like domain-containing protein [candidate division Zixibacteria bacterium]
MARTKQATKALKALNYSLFEEESLIPPAPVTLHTKIRLATQKQPVDRPAVGLTTSYNGLPEVTDLYRRFDIFNWTFFGGKLPSVKIEYSNRMCAAGSYSRQVRLIRIGRKYHEIFPDEIDDTLKHEMIHIVHFRHDARFKKVAARIGASIKAKAHPSLRRQPKFIYVCPLCDKEYPRQKRLVMASCGKCSTGRTFDRKCKLKLQKSVGKQNNKTTDQVAGDSTTSSCG